MRIALLAFVATGSHVPRLRRTRRTLLISAPPLERIDRDSRSPCLPAAATSVALPSWLCPCRQPCTASGRFDVAHAAQCLGSRERIPSTPPTTLFACDS